MNRILLTFFIILSYIFNTHAELMSSFRYGFDEGVPEGIMCYDLDGNNPSGDLVGYEFGIDSAWIRHYVENEDNYVMASTSWYEPAGRSNDWMVLPAVYIDTDGMVLSWMARSTHKSLRDGYSVYLSETGNTPEDFDDGHLLYNIEREENSWVRRSVPLDDYKGKTVYVAFVNDSEDCSVLWIDDISVDTDKLMDITLTSSILVKPDETIRLKGFVNSLTGEAPADFTIGWDCETEKGEIYYGQVTPDENGCFQFDIETGIKLKAEDDVIFKAYVEKDGTRTDRIMTLYPRYKRVLVEEATGTWCGYCVRGMVMSERMHEAYPESFVSMAYHSDVMAVDYFMQRIGAFLNLTSFPSACCNRELKYRGDPLDVYVNYDKIQNEKHEAGLEISVSKIDGGYLAASSEFVFADNIKDADYTISYQIIENDVHVPDDARYCQSNSYSGSDEEMGGFESMPSIIPASLMYYPEVVRGEICDFGGIDGSVPTVIEKGMVYNHLYEFQLPEDVLDPHNCEVVAILTDRKRGSVVNCASFSLSGLYPSSAEMIESSGVSVRAETGCLYVESDSHPSVLITTFDGKVIFNGHQENQCVRYDVLSGIYLVKVDGHVEKIIVN